MSAPSSGPHACPFCLPGRPPFRARSRQEAEDFFLDALAKWHEELGLGKMVLLGHSLGGYLAASYALRYPEHVEHLILVCSAGMVRPACRFILGRARACLNTGHEHAAAF